MTNGADRVTRYMAPSVERSAPRSAEENHTFQVEQELALWATPSFTLHQSDCTLGPE